VRRVDEREESASAVDSSSGVMEDWTDEARNERNHFHAEKTLTHHGLVRLGGLDCEERVTADSGSTDRFEKRVASCSCLQHRPDSPFRVYIHGYPDRNQMR
jgi:hypothetical protein